MCNTEINTSTKELTPQEQTKLYNLGLLAITGEVRSVLDEGYNGPGVDQVMDADDQALMDAKERIASLRSRIDSPNPTNEIRLAINAMCARAQAMV